MSHAVRGHPRRTGRGGQLGQNMVPWRREWQPTSGFLPWEPHGQYEQNTEGKQRPKMQTTPNWQVAGLIKKEMYNGELSWAAAK